MKASEFEFRKQYACLIHKELQRLGFSWKNVEDSLSLSLSVPISPEKCLSNIDIVIEIYTFLAKQIHKQRMTRNNKTPSKRTFNSNKKKEDESIDDVSSTTRNSSTCMNAAVPNTHMKNYDDKSFSDRKIKSKRRNIKSMENPVW